MTPRAEYEQYVRENIHLFLRLALQLSGDLEQAKEVVQLVIIKLWRRWQLEGPDAKRHAYRALHTVTIDEYRRRKRLREVPIDTDRTRFDDVRDAEPGTDEEVRDAVKELPLPLHRVVFLRYYGGLSVGETAELLQISNAQVSRDLYRAHVRLRVSLAHRAMKSS